MSGSGGPRPVEGPPGPSPAGRPGPAGRSSAGRTSTGRPSADRSSGRAAKGRPAPGEGPEQTGRPGPARKASPAAGPGGAAAGPGKASGARQGAARSGRNGPAARPSAAPGRPVVPPGPAARQPGSASPASSAGSGRGAVTPPGPARTGSPASPGGPRTPGKPEKPGRSGAPGSPARGPAAQGGSGASGRQNPTGRPGAAGRPGPTGRQTPTGRPGPAARPSASGSPGRTGRPEGRPSARPDRGGASGTPGRPVRPPARPGAAETTGRPVRPGPPGGPVRPGSPETTRRPPGAEPRGPVRVPRADEPPPSGGTRPGARGERPRAGGRGGGPGGRPPRPPARPVAVLRLGNPRRRIGIGLMVMTFVLSIFAGRLIQLQGLDSKVYTAEAAKQRVQEERLPARRGSITDVKGHELALTLEAREIFVDPSEISDDRRDQVATILAKELNTTKETILAKLADRTSRYQQIAAAADPAVAQRIMAHDLKGVGSKHRYRRDYPGGDLAGTLLGFVGTDGTGLAGLESTYDKLLAGRDGKQIIETGRQGQRIPMTRSTLQAPIEGRDVRLTIDRDVQWAAQKVIAEQVEATGSRTGSVIVMDVPTGQVVAMANAPELDLGNWMAAAGADRVNRSVTDVFEPGSTNKVITAAAALESGAVRPETPFTVPDQIRCADQVLKDSHPHPVERLTFSGIVATSSNVGTILATQRIGDEKLHSMLQRFGFGTRPGTGLPGEEAGLLPDWKDWSGSQRCTIAYGQGVSVTALQTASVYQTIANGGVRVTPQVVAGTTGENGAFTASPPAERTRVISERTAREVSAMLEAAVSEGGTGNLASIDGYRVAGKTGTAMRYDTRCQGYCGYTATFVGFAPADKPRLVVLAVLQDPQEGHYGGEIAAPVFKRVMTFALKSGKIPPTGTRPSPVRIRAGE
ncbi:penicillin-binding transpeptidase domain-containing protein [Streptosporangium sp. NPDC050855]|uniref:peptidoglycan D,D-transpeptidase FtsI family protein n=1 Tax=Streptosporangium sp. NPDC050855 TaxID=3366194 RepID=UPI0037961BB0